MREVPKKIGAFKSTKEKGHKPPWQIPQEPTSFRLHKPVSRHQQIKGYIPPGVKVKSEHEILVGMVKGWTELPGGGRGSITDKVRRAVAVRKAIGEKMGKSYRTTDRFHPLIPHERTVRHDLPLHRPRALSIEENVFSEPKKRKKKGFNPFEKIF